ncbi:hypothetical protein D9M72_517900 [compost metagenome]
MVRSPLTAVQAPLPSTIKRSADWVCRWLGAISPGRISCRPAYSVEVMLDLPGMPGFSSTSTRRTASSALMTPPACITSGRICAYFQMAGTICGRGCGGTSACSDSHNGVMWLRPISS